MKRILAVLLLVFIVVSLAGCCTAPSHKAANSGTTDESSRGCAK